MSSPRGIEHNTSEGVYQRESVLQTEENGQDSVRTRRHPSAMTPYLTDEQLSWAQREPLGFNPTASSSSSSAARVIPSSQVESARYAPIPFPISNMPAEARRQSIMAMDRKRRLTGSNHESTGRRRNLASVFSEVDEVPFSRTSTSDNLSATPRPPNTSRRHHSSPGASATVIDLTNSPPQALVRPASITRRSSGSTSGLYVVPRWQPDSEVTECPICKRQFTFLFRRHHCRKCGRVVCNDCSPHRITIPRQFIVNPPGPDGDTTITSRDTVDLTGDNEDDEDEEHSSYFGSSQQHRYSHGVNIGGGEKVRLCNPCVPDPQPEPQLNYSSSTLPSPSIPNRRDNLLTLSDVLRSARHGYQNGGSTEPFPGFVHHQQQSSYVSHPARTRPLPLLPQPRNESEMNPAHMNAVTYHPSDAGDQTSDLRSILNPSQRHRQRGTMSYEGPQTIHNHHRHHASESSRIPPQFINRPRMSSMLDETYMPRMLSGQLPQFRPRLNEEDICPICRRALPPKGPGGDETAREAHIIDCISSRDPSSQTSTSRGSGSMQSPSRGPMHMLPFTATEKDCVGDDGNVPECSICMVEYDVGDELARLECLCKFHRECISEWFARKRECPVHKIS